MSNKDSFVVYRSFYDAMQPLPEEAQLQLYKAIFEFGLNHKELELDDLPKAMFALIKPQLEANHKRWVNGNKGGRPKEPKNNLKETKTKPKQNLNKTKHKPNVNVNDNDNVNDNVYISNVNAKTQIEMFGKDKVENLFKHRLALKKPILTERMLVGLCNAIAIYANAWSISWEQAYEFYLSKSWISIDPEYKYTDRIVKNQQTQSMTASDIKRELIKAKENLVAFKQVGER